MKSYLHWSFFFFPSSLLSGCSYTFTYCGRPVSPIYPVGKIKHSIPYIVRFLHNFAMRTNYAVFWDTGSFFWPIDAYCFRLGILTKITSSVSLDSHQGLYRESCFSASRLLPPITVWIILRTTLSWDRVTWTANLSNFCSLCTLQDKPSSYT